MLSTLSEDELVIAYGLDSAIPESGSIKYSVAAGGGGLVGGSIKGFCSVATIQDIEKQDCILTPGRYVGIEEREDDGEPFDVF